MKESVGLKFQRSYITVRRRKYSYGVVIVFNGLITWFTNSKKSLAVILD